MTKLIVLLVSIIWASLLLISWGGAEDIPRPPATQVAENRGL